MPAIEFDGFAFAYPGQEQPTLHDVSFQIADGAFALIGGCTGSGKTTLIRSAKPEIAPFGKVEGGVKVFGRKVAGMGSNHADIDVASRDVGFVFQDPRAQIVCDSVFRELAFGLECMGMDQQTIKRRVAEVASIFGISPWFTAKCSELSDGQRQILNLASVIAMHPKVLALDEPTSQLDPVATQRFLAMLFRLNREFGLTIACTTHSPELFAGYATELFMIEDGCVHEEPIDSIRAEPIIDCASVLPTGARMADSVSSEVDDGSHSGQAVVLEDAFFGYSSDAPYVLHGLDLAISQGEIMAITGANGSGKTTLLNLIAGIIHPQRGSIRNALAESQAYVPQDPKLMFICDTVESELMEWRSASDGYCDAANRYAREFGLGAKQMEMSPFDLSGGQQQLLAMAKAMALGPGILLADEPSRSLDDASRLKLGRAMVELAGSGSTIAFITHDLEFAACVADKVALVFDGQIAACQPASEFFEGNILYKPKMNGFMRLWMEHARC